MLLVETALRLGGAPGAFQSRPDSIPSFEEKE